MLEKIVYWWEYEYKKLNVYVRNKGRWIPENANKAELGKEKESGKKKF